MCSLRKFWAWELATVSRFLSDDEERVYGGPNQL